MNNKETIKLHSLDGDMKRQSTHKGTTAEIYEKAFTCEQPICTLFDAGCSEAIHICVKT